MAPAPKKATPKAAPNKTTQKQPPPQTPREAHPEHYEAARAEAENGARMDPTPLLKVVSWRGYTLRVPPSIEDWDIEIQEAAEAQQPLRHLALILGDEQYQKLRDDKALPKMGDVNNLMDTIGKQAYGGAKMGE